jgi:hypothetical protein
VKLSFEEEEKPVAEKLSADQLVVVVPTSGDD